MNPKEYIKTQGLRGFRKTKIRVTVENERGQEREVVVGELTHVRNDRRHRRRLDYVTLLSFSHRPRIDLTYNIATHRISFNIWQGFHHAYALIENEDLAKLFGAIEYLYPRYRGLFSNKLEAIDPCMPLLAKYYQQQTQKKIIAARRAWFRSARRRRGYRP